MQHLLFDDRTGKTVSLTCEEQTVTSVSNGRTTSKSFEDPGEAVKQFLKKEWDLLKKGAVMRAATAALGHPLLHLYIAKGYTGALSFAATPHGVYVYRPAEDFKDEMVRVTEDGVMAEILVLPKPLAWEMWYDAQENQLLLDLDHYIYAYDLASAAFQRLTDTMDQPASFVSVAGGVRAYGTHPVYYISQEPQAFPLDVKIINGSIALCAALSPDGKWLALHNEEGVVKLINTTDHNDVNVITGDFGKVEQLLWTRDGSQLLVREWAAQSRLRVFGIATGEEVSYEGLQLPTFSQYLTDCCLSPDNALLVCSQRTHAYVFDFVNKTFLYSFPLQHVVKRAHIRFVDERKLGVRTDYGCFSIYQL
jgi:hypothetical protein